MKVTKRSWVQLGVVGPVVCALGLAEGLAFGALHKSPAAEEQSPESASANAEAAKEKSKADTQNDIVIERIEPDETSSKEVAWLGVGVDEAGDALASQLGLQSGEGLVVTFVATDSPAAKAGIQKNDVLVEFDNQLLVHPAQLRKLVQMHKSGDTVRLEVFRGGKKETIEVTLAKTRTGFGFLQDERAWHGDMSELHRQLQELNGRNREELQKQMKALHESLSKAGLDQEKMRAQVRRSIEEARRAADAALRQASNQLHSTGNFKMLQELAHGDQNVNKDSTVIIKRKDQSVQTQVKADDDGTYVIVANPTKRLTAHDKDGKLLFDGEIETPEQQEKVPKEVWAKVEPMLKNMGKSEAEDENQ